MSAPVKASRSNKPKATTLKSKVSIKVNDLNKIPYVYDPYVTNKSNLRKTLDTYGVAIIPNVLNEEECDAMVNGMWQTLAHFSSNWGKSDEENAIKPIDKEDATTWRGIKELYPKHAMLIQNFKIGHAQFVWDVRTNPNVVDIFADFWDCHPNDLIASFDAVSFHLPPEITNIGFNLGNTWHHTDQSFTKKGFQCLQSWVTGFDVCEGDATLSILEGSHKYHEEFGTHFNITNKDDWYKLSSIEEKKFYLSKGCREVCIKCPKGSLVLWDSRLIHCGVESRKGRVKPNIRCVAYLCYTKRSDVNQKILQKRIKMFEKLRTTTHWPNKAKPFADNPWTHGGKLKEITPLPRPNINALGRRLVGYDDVN